jgi:TolB-like protein
VGFLEELKRRNVVRVGVAYCVIAWIIAQLAEFAFENFGAPDWVLKAVVVLLVLGLPLALFFAWVFELTPEGVRREQDVDRSASITPNTGRTLDRFIIVGLVAALGYFLWERQDLGQPQNDVVNEAAESNLAIEPSNSAAAEQAPRSIAVLPFLNMSSDPEQEYFSDGLTEEILNALARTPDLQVASRTSSFNYKGSSEDITAIAQALGVAHVLEGSVRRDSKRLRVTAQLIRANDGFHLWSQTYDRNPDDVIAIQEDIAIEIALALETAMDPEALARMVSAGTSTVAAYNAYLEGLGWNATSVSTGDIRRWARASEAYERAIELDPEFALAYWELAKFWEVQRRGTDITAGQVDMSREEMLTRFERAIEKAIEFEKDPVNALKYRVLRETENLRLDRALVFNTDYLQQRPNNIFAQRLQLNFFNDLNMYDEMVEEIARLNDREALGVGMVSDYLTASLITNDPDFIRNTARVSLERLGDESVFIVYQAHRALLWAGDIDAAAPLARELGLSDLPDTSRSLVALRQACAEGRQVEAEGIYQRVTEQYADDASIIWIVHKIMGAHDQAVATLKPLDDRGQIDELVDYVSYAYFDPRPFPNLMNLLTSLGIEPREPLAIPYRCKG